MTNVCIECRITYEAGTHWLCNLCWENYVEQYYNRTRPGIEKAIDDAWEKNR